MPTGLACRTGRDNSNGDHRPGPYSSRARARETQAAVRSRTTGRHDLPTRSLPLRDTESTHHRIADRLTQEMTDALRRHRANLLQELQLIEVEVFRHQLPA